MEPLMPLFWIFSVGRGDSPGVGDSFANIFTKTYEFRNILSVGNGLLGFDCLGILTFLPPANEVWCKVIFSEACVKNSVHGGGCLSACWDTSPREHSMLGDTVNVRAVRILLECILFIRLFGYQPVTWTFYSSTHSAGDRPMFNNK